MKKPIKKSYKLYKKLQTLIIQNKNIFTDSEHQKEIQLLFGLVNCQES